MQTIGFIGVGVMGRSMAGHLLDAGYPLVVHSRTRAKAEELLARGVQWAESPAVMADRCEAIFTIVGFPKDVEEVYFGENGLLARLRPGTILVDMTTSSPELAKRIAAAAAARGAQALDAPVSGGDKGAREGTLSIMVGGDEAAFQTVLPLFGKMGTNIVRQGPAGSGQHCKMCNQITIAATMVGVCEALAYARRSGLDPETVLRSISTGAAGSWSLSNLAPRILADNFAPGFYVKHFIKDMAIAAREADGMGLDTPGLDLALSLYRRLAEQGGEDDGTQALYRLYE
jgi:3-hydroxyisobutyrate dehydrogenase